MITIDPNPQLTTDQFIFPDIPAGYTNLTQYSTPFLAELTPSDDVVSITIDFVSNNQIDYLAFFGAFTSHFPYIAQNFSNIVLAYALYQGAEQDLTIPNQICWQDYCWVPPFFAGDTVASLYHYRLWLLLQPLQPGSALAMPQVGFWEVALTLIKYIFITIAPFVVLGVMNAIAGKESWSDVLHQITGALPSPGNIATGIGQGVSGGLSWPFFALGTALVAAGIFLPALTTRATVTGIPGVQLEAGTTTGGGGAPRRRR